MNKLGIVTVLYNSNEVLPDFFKSISRQDFKNYIVFIVDNSPSANTRKVIGELQNVYQLTKIEHIENEANEGVAAANNTGITKAIKEGCNKVLISNNDIYFEQSDLFNSIINLSEQKNKAIIAPKVYYAGNGALWYAGGDIIKWMAQVRHYGDTQQDKGQFDKAGYCSYAPTCFVLVPVELFNKIGIMDEKYFVYMDDTDFMYRAGLTGFRVWYEPTLKIYHKVSAATGGMWTDFSLFYNLRNRVYFSRKHYSAAANLFVISYVSLSSIFFAFKNGVNSPIKKVYKAIISGFKIPVS